ncbi:MAG: polysaccharide biosynthesis/export family protein [Pseudomonadota bacterium]
MRAKVLWWYFEDLEFAKFLSIVSSIQSGIVTIVRCFTATILPTVLTLLATPLLAMELGPGDQVGFSIVGFTELDREVTIDPSGTIHLPLVGRVQAGGMTIEELEESVSEAFALETFSIQGDEQETVWVSVDASSVLLSVASFRPVYVSGAVETNGEFPFRSGMSVRQLHALAGGSAFVTEDDRIGAAARLVAQRSVLRAELVTLEGEIDRLNLELVALRGQSPASEGAAVTSNPRVNEWLESRAQFREIQQETTEFSLREMRERLEVLENLENVNNEIIRSYDEELARARDLNDRGLTTADTVSDAERGFLAFSSRALETESEAYAVRNDIALTDQTLKEETAEELAAVLDELLTRENDVAMLLAELNAIEIEMSILQIEAAEPDEEGEETVSIFRIVDGQEQEIAAEMSSTVMPGDVVVFGLSTDE